KLELDRLVLGDRLPEGLPFLRVFDRFLERTLRDAQRARSHIDASDLDRGHVLDEALTLFAPEEVRCRNVMVVERDLSRLNALVAELLDVLSDDDAPGLLGTGLLLDDE